MIDDGEALLRWLSGERSGSVTQLKDRLSWFASTVQPPILTTPATEYAWLDDMTSLGYLDVSYSLNRWSAARPTLTRLPGVDGLLLVTGARNGALAAALRSLSSDAEVWTRNPRPESPLPLPETVYLQPGSESAVGRVLAELRTADPSLASTSCSSLMLSMLLGSTAKTLSSIASPVGDEAGSLHVLNADNLWTLPGVNASMWESTPAPVPGAVHRWTSRTGMRFGWLSEGGWMGGPRAAVIYAGLSAAARHVLRWLPQPEFPGTGTLIAPMKLGLPTIHDRVVTLATGLRPVRGLTGLKYGGVPVEIARRISRSLGQMLNETGD